jgi:hypothetical protein
MITQNPPEFEFGSNVPGSAIAAGRSCGAATGAGGAGGKERHLDQLLVFQFDHQI